MILGDPWGLIFHTFLRLFFDIFLDPSRNHLASTFGRFGVHLASILGAVLVPFWGTGPKVKIELSSARELNFEGPDPSKIDVFSGPILRGVPGPHRIYLFMDFVDFGLVFDAPWTPIGASIFDPSFSSFSKPLNLRPRDPQGLPDPPPLVSLRLSKKTSSLSLRSGLSGTCRGKA